MTEEGRIKAKVKKLLKSFGSCYQHWPVLSGMGAPTLDCICSYRGYYIAIETKAPKCKPTPRQRATMAEMGAAGAFVFVVASDEDLAIVEAYLQLLGD